MPTVHDHGRSEQIVSLNQTGQQGAFDHALPVKSDPLPMVFLAFLGVVGGMIANPATDAGAIGLAIVALGAGLGCLAVYPLRRLGRTAPGAADVGAFS